MRAGSLRHRIKIQQPVHGEEWNQKDMWIDLVSLWASIEPLRGREFIALRSVGADETGTLKIRYRADIHPEMRVIWGSRTYEIKEIIDPEERHKDLFLVVKEFIG